MSRFRQLMVVALAASSVVLGVTHWADAKNKCRPICRQPATCCAPQATCCQPQPACCAPQMGSGQVFPSTVDVTYCATSGYCYWMDEMNICQYATWYAEACPPNSSYPPILFDAACDLDAHGCLPEETFPDPNICVTITRSLSSGLKGVPTNPRKHPKLTGAIPGADLRPRFTGPHTVIFGPKKSFLVTIGAITIKAVSHDCRAVGGGHQPTPMEGHGHQIQNVGANAESVTGTKVSTNVLRFTARDGTPHQIVTFTPLP